MKKWLRHIWHVIFYMLAPPSAQKFAMTCKEAVTQVDDHEGHNSFLQRLRVTLHLGLCQGCNNYYRAGHALGLAIRSLMQGSTSVDLEKINKELLEKHANYSHSRK